MRVPQIKRITILMLLVLISNIICPSVLATEPLPESSPSVPEPPEIQVAPQDPQPSSETVPSEISEQLPEPEPEITE